MMSWRSDRAWARAARSQQEATRVDRAARGLNGVPAAFSHNLEPCAPSSSSRLPWRRRWSCRGVSLPADVRWPGSTRSRSSTWRERWPSRCCSAGASGPGTAVTTRSSRPGCWPGREPGSAFRPSCPAPRWPRPSRARLQALRRARVPPGRLDEFARGAEHLPGRRGTPARPRPGLRGASTRPWSGATDPATLLAAAAEGLESAGWLAEAEVLVVDDLELDPVERDFLAALARLAAGARAPKGASPGPAALVVPPRGRRATASPRWPRRRRPSVPSPRPRLPRGSPACGRASSSRRRAPRSTTDSVALVSAPGEAAEVRTIVRRLLDEAARGVPFEEMGVVLPRPETLRAAVHRPAGPPRDPPPAPPLAAPALRPVRAVAAPAPALPRARAGRR